MAELFANIAVDCPAPGIAVIHVPENFDVYEAPGVRRVHVELVQQLVYVHVFDLTATRFVDSTGLGVLVGALKRLRSHGGVLVLDSPAPGVRHALTVTGLVKIFHVVEPVYVPVADPGLPH
jgi:anti-sigma B factor antagonist